MTVSKENTRVQVTMPKTLREALEKEAENDSRTLSNYIVHILLQRDKLKE
ncbi:hypothetical protein ACFO25_00215 [Paenactinomyces guangxiensis]|uniref:DNA-binding protein n=1 Tax=Paenactinomyces guangxiensis TaxID=1490290 RepID=A0A7W2A859_9BACL|nr:DNA-binding protein [Paenactinomyces guangxiensis]MBA4495256.1 DNA-binding protein [Paenactinomyces guangxiensis]MBH8592340.1 hypothetical protein [Paenactinomyces guangxiensis]